jgi:glycosyltransferase involved in cell wall biosynthesis
MRIALNAQKLSFARAYQAGGISRYIYHLLTELRRGDSTHAYQAFVPTLPRLPELEATSRFSIRTTGAWSATPAWRVLWEQAVLPLQAAPRFDLLHGLAFATPLAWPKRSVVTVFDLSFLRYPQLFNRANRAYLTFFTRRSVRRADRVLTIAEHGRREVIELLGAPPERVTTTYCGVDPGFRPLPAGEVEAFRLAQGLPERFILYLGTLEPRKNVATLVRAYALLRAELPTAPPLVLAGAPGWMYDEVYRAIDEHGLRDAVLLPGFVAEEELSLWYNAAAVFAYPSLYEGFGLPPLEAMACGTPVITSDTTSLPEVVGEAGLLVQPFDQHGLASALRRVLVEPDLAAHLRQAGPLQAARFTWRRMAEATVRCYDELASQR